MSIEIEQYNNDAVIRDMSVEIEQHNYDDEI